MSLFSSDHDLKISLWWPLPSSLQICNFYHVTVSKLGECEQDDHFVNSNDYGSVVPSDINQKDDSPQSSIKWHGRNKPSSVVYSYSLATMFFSHYVLPPDRCPQCHGWKGWEGVWYGGVMTVAVTHLVCFGDATGGELLGLIPALSCGYSSMLSRCAAVWWSYFLEDTSLKILPPSKHPLWHCCKYCLPF